MDALSVMNLLVAEDELLAAADELLADADELLAEAAAGARVCQNSSSAPGSSSPSMVVEVLFAPAVDEDDDDAADAEESKCAVFDFGAVKLDAGCKMFAFGAELLEDEAPPWDDAGATGTLRALPITNADGC